MRALYNALGCQRLCQLKASYEPTNCWKLEFWWPSSGTGRESMVMELEQPNATIYD
jgi:hypothetical protein